MNNFMSVLMAMLPLSGVSIAPEIDGRMATSQREELKVPFDATKQPKENVTLFLYYYFRLIHHLHHIYSNYNLHNILTKPRKSCQWFIETYRLYFNEMHNVQCVN